MLKSWAFTVMFCAGAFLASDATTSKANAGANMHHAAPSVENANAYVMKIRDNSIEITCESNHFKYRYCGFQSGRSPKIRLKVELSRSSCHRGRTWGYDNNGVWVDDGCRAVFSVQFKNSGKHPSHHDSHRDRRPNPDWSGGGGKTPVIECASYNQRRNKCRVKDANPKSAYLKKQLSNSPCVKGQSWGTYRDGVWVDQGCRAQFGFNRR